MSRHLECGCGTDRFCNRPASALGSRRQCRPPAAIPSFSLNTSRAPAFFMPRNCWRSRTQQGSDHGGPCTSGARSQQTLSPIPLLLHARASRATWLQPDAPGRSLPSRHGYVSPRVFRRGARHTCPRRDGRAPNRTSAAPNLRRRPAIAARGDFPQAKRPPSSRQAAIGAKVFDNLRNPVQFLAVGRQDVLTRDARRLLACWPPHPVDALTWRGIRWAVADARQTWSKRSSRLNRGAPIKGVDTAKFPYTTARTDCASRHPHYGVCGAPPRLLQTSSSRRRRAGRFPLLSTERRASENLPGDSRPVPHVRGGYHRDFDHVFEVLTSRVEYRYWVEKSARRQRP